VLREANRVVNALNVERIRRLSDPQSFHTGHPRSVTAAPDLRPENGMPPPMAKSGIDAHIPHFWPADRG
jgi:hypothetical protein